MANSRNSDRNLAVSMDTAHHPELKRRRIKLEELRQKGIFIIDGHSQHTLPVIDMLSKSGFSRVIPSADHYQDVNALLRVLHQNACDIDLILLDITNVDLGGLDLCYTIQRQKKLRDIPLVLIASKSMWQEELVYSAFQVGATDIVFRPVQRLELVPRVISALLLKEERDLRQHHKHELENELAERKVIEARLQYLVSHDELTGLWNRRRLEQALETAVFHCQRKKHISALLYIDLDQFKLLNDAEGHAVGDRFLMSIANKLRQEIESEDILARISSDEYAILVGNTNEQNTLHIAEVLRSSIDRFRFNTNNKNYHTGASIGVAMINPGEELTASEVLARAAQACFEAKTHGRNMVHLFNHNDMEMHIIRSAADWVPRIREALNKDRLCMYYQPVIDVNTGKITGHEALIRMLDHDGSLIMPDNFIPVAERMGLIHDIDLCVINHAIDVLQQIPASYQHLTLNINLSMYAFQDPTLLPLVRNKLATTGVAAQRITFEITETAAVSNYANTRRIIKKLRELGCRFALDDFGTGFSSFNYIKQFPVDYLKIDGSFIRNLVHDKVDQRLVKSMIEVARTLDKKIVAEYVENGEILRLLKEYGVNLAQGHYIGRPEREMQLT